MQSQMDQNYGFFRGTQNLPQNCPSTTNLANKTTPFSSKKWSIDLIGPFQCDLFLVLSPHAKSKHLPRATYDVTVTSLWLRQIDVIMVQILTSLKMYFLRQAAIRNSFLAFLYFFGLVTEKSYWSHESCHELRRTWRDSWHQWIFSDQPEKNPKMLEKSFWWLLALKNTF